MEDTEPKKPKITVSGPMPVNLENQSLQLQRATTVYGVPPFTPIDSLPHSTRCSVALKTERGRYCLPSDLRRFLYTSEPQVTSEEKRLNDVKRKAGLVSNDPGTQTPSHWSGSLKMFGSTVLIVVVVNLVFKLAKR